VSRRAGAPPGRARRLARHRGAPLNKVNLAEKLALISDYWSPKVVGELNGQHVRLVKFAGEFVWHHHEREDELFLVLRGAMAIHFRDRVVELAEGEFCIVPSGVEHKPVAAQEACVLLLEPASTRNTGNVREARTREELERI
jgi:mannose-6-phosphate isomerase-like protein (cupin superfamily)